VIFTLFSTRKRAELINLMNCFFKTSASKIKRISDLMSRNMENMIQALNAVSNEEMGYLAAAKI
jgi:hypothetical protein